MIENAPDWKDLDSNQILNIINQNDADIKDKEEHLHKLQTALNMLEVGINYPTLELIIMVDRAITKRPKRFSIKCAVDLKSKWFSKWGKYFYDRRGKKLEKFGL